MLKRNHTSLWAGVALAATLALPTTPLLAQAADAPTMAPAQPVLTLPQSPPPAAPAPTVMLPTELPKADAPASANPVVAPATARSTAPSPQAATETPAVRRATATPAPIAAEPAPVVSASVAPEAGPELIAPSSTPITDEPGAAADADRPTAEADNSRTYALAAVIGLLAVVALAVWGFIAIGRRKQPPDRVAAPAVARPMVAEPPVVAEPRVHSWANPRPIAPGPAASLSHSGAAVALPRAMPASFAERDALLKRMVAARPDRANPFTDYRARLKRARLILQSLGRDFSEVEPWIDLSQYPANWPELARKHTAAA